VLELKNIARRAFVVDAKANWGFIYYMLGDSRLYFCCCDPGQYFPLFKRAKRRGDPSVVTVSVCISYVFVCVTDVSACGADAAFELAIPKI